MAIPYDEAIVPVRTDTDARGATAPHRRLLASCFFGTTIEWYDFLVYAFLAPLVFDRLFFPKVDSVTATIAVFGIFAVGFGARPLGGIFFAHFGDRFGRKPIMVATLVLAGVSTTAIGLVPTYAQIGLAAPVLLTVLRFLQGFALGGESAAGPLLAMESAPQGRRGLFAACVQSGASAGTALGATATLAVAMLPDEQLLSWGWRVPFLAGAVIFLVGYYLRMKVAESPVFTQAISRRRPERVPLVAVLKHHKRATLLVLCCALAESSVFYFTSVFGLSYGLQKLHLPRELLLSGILIGNAIGVFANPAFGALSDRIGRRRLLAAAFGLGLLYVAFVFFPLLRSGEAAVVVLAMAIPGALLQPMSLASSGSFYAELFSDARSRLSGVSLGRQSGTILGGGLMPMIAASLLAWSGGNLAWVIGYFALLCLLALGAVWQARETARDRLQ